MGARTITSRLFVIAALAVVGVVSAGYVLVKQRLPVPLRDTYEVKAVLAAADGVAPGVGQSVNVSGVKVGSIKAAELEQDRALLTLEIKRSEVPSVHQDARVILQPITPVKDMQIELDPGSESSPELGEGDRIPLSQTRVPVELSTLLSQLDVDTRAFMTSLLVGLGQGTKDRAPDLRKLLLSFGPTTAQVRELTDALAGRRRELARLVHGVSAVTRAAASDGRLADVVASGNRTLQAVASQDAQLRQAVQMLPGAMTTARSALRNLGDLSSELRPAVRELTPPVREFPDTLEHGIKPIATSIDDLIRTELRPFTAKAQPLARELGPALRRTSRAMPDLSRTLQGLNYFLNEAAYNPPGKEEEGPLFWIGWGLHNYGSAASTGDSHGALTRVALFLDCKGLLGFVNLRPYVQAFTGAMPCPED